jgi:serine/threonine protein kinase
MTNNNDDSEPILFDFCLAKIFKENDNLKNPIGTIGYIAPEILLNNNYSYKSEVYNIGVISYFLLTGYMPLNFELSDKDIIKQTLYTEINYPNELWKNINPDAKNFVANCLTKIPEKRYDLEDIINDEWIYQSNC